MARLVPSNGVEGQEESVLGWPGDEIAEYSKCGRTDAGVSAFGQVIGVRVRSNRPLPVKPEDGKEVPVEGDEAAEGDEVVEGGGMVEFDDAKDELQYCQILNRLLPRDIRALAWCPNPPPNFSARFNCQQRHYRYFFTNPAIAPITTSPSPSFNGTLDIARMRAAAHLFVGNHDFRNFCKLDASKQITRFDRIIHHSDIVELPPPTGDPTKPTICYFELHGSAFLWHQVRHMIAILFLIAQGLEEPSLVKNLLDVTKTPRKPEYEMADDCALVLWDCVFPDGMLSWVNAHGGGRDGRFEVMDDVWAIWHKAKIDEVLAGTLMDALSSVRETPTPPSPASLMTGHPGEFVVTDKAVAIATAKKDAKKKSQVIILGGHEPRFRGRYTPVLQRRTMDDVEAINRRYAERKGDWRENRRKREAKRLAADE